MTGQLADDKADKITRMSHYSKLFPNFLTVTDAPSERQKVGNTDFETSSYLPIYQPTYLTYLTYVPTYLPN